MLVQVVMVRVAQKLVVEHWVISISMLLISIFVQAKQRLIMQLSL